MGDFRYYQRGTAGYLYFDYRNPAGAGVTGKVSGDFTVQLTKDGTGNQATTGITGPTEVDASNNAGTYVLSLDRNTSFVATDGTYNILVFDTANPTYAWQETLVVANGNTFTATSAEFTATASDGRVTDGTDPVQGATVVLRTTGGTQVAQVTTDSDGLWGPVYLTETVTAYAQKSGFTQATGTVTVSGTTATGPGSDLAMTATTSSASLLGSAVWGYIRRMCRDRVGARSDEVIRQIADEAMMLTAKYTQSSWYLREGEISFQGNYNTGTVSINDGSTTLTLSGGTFPSWAASGEVALNGRYYKVTSRDSDTQLTLTTAYQGSANLSGATYDLVQHAYSLPDDLYQFHQLYPGDNWSWGPEPIGWQEYLDLKNDHTYTLSQPYAWAIGHGKLHVWPPPASDEVASYSYLAKPTPLSASGDTADIDPNMLDVFHRACDHQVALRFQDTEGGLDAGTTWRVFKEVAAMVPSNDRSMPRRPSPSGGRRRRGIAGHIVPPAG